MTLPLLLCAAGAFWGLAWRWIAHTPFSGLGLMALMALGLAARGLAFALPPFEEIDFYRYFWDGRQLLNGFNPYAYPISGLVHPLPPDLIALQAQNAEIVGNIHPRTLLLSTLYAPAAVGLFALLDAAPGGLFTAYFVSFLLAEAAALGGLWRWGGAQNFRLGLWALALNPLVLVTTHNGLHFDIWLLPLLLGWVLALRAQRPGLALACLGIAIVLRHWPVLLLPLSLMAWPRLAQRLRWGLVAIGALGLVFLPQLSFLAEDHAGLRVYGRLWQMNDAVFMAISSSIGPALTRALALLVPAGLSLILALWTKVDPADAGVWVVGSLLVLSPTFFPWYALWLLPFLILARTPMRWAGIALTATLPLYYLRFWLQDLGQETLFDRALVWAEFAPIYGLIVLFAFRSLFIAHRQSDPARPQ